MFINDLLDKLPKWARVIIYIIFPPILLFVFDYKQLSSFVLICLIGYFVYKVFSNSIFIAIPMTIIITYLGVYTFMSAQCKLDGKNIDHDKVSYMSAICTIPMIVFIVLDMIFSIPVLKGTPITRAISIIVKTPLAPVIAGLGAYIGIYFPYSGMASECIVPQSK